MIKDLRRRKISYVVGPAQIVPGTDCAYRPDPSCGGLGAEPPRIKLGAWGTAALQRGGLGGGARGGLGVAANPQHQALF
jgi:hypothetical protein